MANKTNKLIVSEISNCLFVIPYYQRGYRWTGKNVKQLLSDLYSFASNADEDSEYCLQPIVLQKISSNRYSDVLQDEGNVVRVVDGQQRLTTIAIVLWKLGIKTQWDIYYDSEKKRLSDILLSYKNSNSINDYFRKEVCAAVDEWFVEHTQKMEVDDNSNKKLKALFETKGHKKIAFLEYDIESSNDNDDSDKEGHKTFLRLNDGKTPLTSSELIRALFMVSSSGLTIQQRMEISKEWEIVENTLQDNQFWLMFNTRGLEDTPTRIDLLFALAIGVSLRETKANPRIVFEKLEDELYDLEKVWNEVLQIFWWMQSCYSDIELCNYLGWIRSYKDISATTIYRNWRKYPVHRDFKDSIIKIIQDTKFGGQKLSSLELVDYNWDKVELRKLFVLLNIFDCNHSNERFRFDLFNLCKGWDIEHIDSQTPNDFKQEKNKIEWLSAAWEELSEEQKNKFLEHIRLKNENTPSAFNIKSINLEDFNFYAEYIVQLTKDSNDKVPDEKTNKLGNLALLNFSINRSYKNDIFPLKRKAIIKHVNCGSEFIPPCTVKAFTKFYTKSASKITAWQNADYNGYYETMDSWFTSFMNYKISIKDGVENTVNLKKEKQYISEISEYTNSEQPSTAIELERYIEPINFPYFMDNYDVVIPKIQRLYVQGRSDKRGEKCLSGFASSLIGSITNSSELLLDFVYGIDTGKSKKKIFYPLDGQQRLTTLLLLSWLCGLSKSEWSFKYESRRSTEVFIAGLLNSNPPELTMPDNYEELKKQAKKSNKDYPSLCKEYICRMPWFHKSWLCDPGIKGMVEMLDSLYDKLLNVPKKDKLSMNSIVFLLNYLDVNKKSYDHIFLKMNSRGRELTEWDNVNAILDEFLPNSIKNSWPEKIQLWYELMWNAIPSTSSANTDKINRVDNQMLSIVELALDCAGYKGKCNNTYELSKWLQEQKDVDDVEYFYDLCGKFFSALEIEKNVSLPYLIPNWSKSGKPRIPNFASIDNNEVVVKFYQPLLVYYASEMSKDKKWIRVIWNLIENIDVERSSFKQAVHLIEELSQGKDSIILYLNNKTISDIKSNYQKAEPQLQEEIDKANQIINGKRPDQWMNTQSKDWTDWYDVIVSVESMRCFSGAIRFIYHDGSYNINWESFCSKWKHVQTYFDNNGIKQEYTSKLIAALIKRCTQWCQVRDHFIFNKSEWKRNVLLDRLYAEPLDYILQSKDLDVDVADFENGLVCERIIRDRISEENLISVITSKYSDYRISSNRYFYGWRKHDGILFDWRTNNNEPEAWELRRNIQIKEMLDSTNDMTVSNTLVSGELYFGYTINFKYNQASFYWPNGNTINLINSNQRTLSTEVLPSMNGKEILSQLQKLIDLYNNDSHSKN